MSRKPVKTDSETPAAKSDDGSGLRPMDRAVVETVRAESESCDQFESFVEWTTPEENEAWKDL